MTLFSQNSSTVSFQWDKADSTVFHCVAFYPQSVTGFLSEWCLNISFALHFLLIFGHIFLIYIYCNFMLIIPWELNYNLWCSCTINWYMNWNVTQVSSRHCPLRRLKLSGCLSPLTPAKLITCLWAFQFNSTPVKITAFICLLHRIGERN